MRRRMKEKYSCGVLMQVEGMRGNKRRRKREVAVNIYCLYLV